jgi:hypothetical protein
VSLLAAVLGCGTKKEAPKFKDAAVVETPRDASVDATPDAAIAKAFTLPAAEPGPIYIVAKDSVAVVLPDGTVHTVDGTKGEVYGLALGADGHAYVTFASELGPARRNHIARLDGATATKVASIKDAFYKNIAVGTDGVIYGAQTDDVYRYEKGTLTALPKPTTFIDELALDASNQLVAAGTGAVFLFTNGAWQSIAIPDLESTDDVWILGSGTDLLLAVGNHGFFALEGGKAVRRYAEYALRNDRPYRTTSGVLAFTVYEDSTEKVRLIGPDGGTTTGTALPGQLSNLVVDARGRLWSLADGALAVVDELGPDRADYPIGTLKPLVGAHRNDEHGMLAMGAGPTTLPAQQAAQLVRQVTATIIIDKKPLARSEVEICTFAAMSYHTSPCEDSKSRKVATTSASGQVTFTDVPLGEYRVAFKHGDTWGFAMGQSITLDRPGASKALGRLDYQTTQTK